MLTLEERGELGARLRHIVGEYAAASQRSDADAKVDAVLDRFTTLDAPADETAAPAATPDADVPTPTDTPTA